MDNTVTIHLQLDEDDKKNIEAYLTSVQEKVEDAKRLVGELSSLLNDLHISATVEEK